MRPSTRQMVEQVSNINHEICYQPSDPDTLVFLKESKELATKIKSCRNDPSKFKFIVLLGVEKSNTHRLSLML